MPSNSPPNVTGSEPHLTRQVEYDPHAPFHVGEDDSGAFRRWVVYYADEEAPWFGAGVMNGWTNEIHAHEFARKLNERWYLRFEDRGRNGFCKVCGDLHGEPPR